MVASRLDAHDRRLLDAVQRDCLMPLDRLAEIVGLSPSATHRRLTRLREDQFIIANIAVVDRRRAGRPMTMLVEIHIERERAELLREFNRWIEEEAAVQQAWYVTGDADFVMVVSAESVEDFDMFMERLLREHSNVRRFKTSVVLRSAKIGLSVPISDMALQKS